MAITCAALVATDLLDDDSQTLSKTRSLLHCVLLALKDDEKLLNQIGLVLTQIWFARNTAGVDAEDLPRNGGSFTQAEILGAIERVGKRSGIQVAKGLMKDGERAWACVSKVQGDSVDVVGGASGLRGLVLNWDMAEAYEGGMDEFGALVVVSFIRELMCMLHDELFPAQRDMDAPPLPGAPGGDLGSALERQVFQGSIGVYWTRIGDFSTLEHIFIDDLKGDRLRVENDIAWLFVDTIRNGRQIIQLAGSSSSPLPHPVLPVVATRLDSGQNITGTIASYKVIQDAGGGFYSLVGADK